MWDPSSPSARATCFEFDCDTGTPDSPEEWKQASGFYTDDFLVSSNGLVIVKHNGKKRPPTRGSLEGNYYRINFNHKRYLVHRIVCETFDRSPLPGETVDHKNNDTRDNRISNLRWATKSEQTLNRVTSKTRRTARPITPIETQEDLPGEVWVRVNNRVMVSSHGRAQTMAYKNSLWTHKYTPKPTGNLSYAAISIEGTEAQFHNVVAKAFGMSWSDNETIDHLDRDRTNNRLANLRVATKTEQNRNRSIKPTGTTHDSLKDPVLAKPFSERNWEMFPSQIEASRILQARTGKRFDSSAISKTLKGKYKQHKGWLFKRAQ